uniref:Uncharacterized protein n=1 Tax=Salix viminalis TaxID=40686 RepID=A0A6N2KNZ0_SALVM
MKLQDSSSKSMPTSSKQEDWNVEHRCLDTMVSKNSMFDDEPGSGGHAPPNAACQTQAQDINVMQ